ncbi:MAG: cupredoxin domain-containing protein [Ornithinibacter sp.]
MPTSSTSSPATEQPAPSPSATADTAEAVISIKDFAFKVPASVAPGAKISITNADAQAHTVTSEAGGFDVKVDPNGTATLTAPSKPGSYPFVCSFHGNMTSTLVVK